MNALMPPDWTKNVQVMHNIIVSDRKSFDLPDCKLTLTIIQTAKGDKQMSMSSMQICVETWIRLYSSLIFTIP